MKIMKIRSFLYTVNAYYEDITVSINTNEVEVVCNELLNRAEEGAAIDLIDNSIGEVLVSYNEEEKYMTPEWTLILVGYLALKTWG